jgi:hypothetical protein
VLLVLLIPRKTLRLAGREHGRAIPLPDIAVVLSPLTEIGQNQDNGSNKGQVISGTLLA